MLHLIGQSSVRSGAPGLSSRQSILIFYEESDGSDGVPEQRGANGKREIRKAVENPQILTPKCRKVSNSDEKCRQTPKQAEDLQNSAEKAEKADNKRKQSRNKAEECRKNAENAEQCPK